MIGPPKTTVTNNDKAENVSQALIENIIIIVSSNQKCFSAQYARIFIRTNDAICPPKAKEY